MIFDSYVQNFERSATANLFARPTPFCWDAIAICKASRITLNNWHDMIIRFVYVLAGVVQRKSRYAPDACD